MASGGRREGAGRKAVSPDNKRATVTVRVLPSTKKKMSVLKAEGVKIGPLIDELISNI